MNIQRVVTVIGGVRYDTATAELIAGNDYIEEGRTDRDGTNRFLWRSGGRFFISFHSQLEGEGCCIEPVSKAEAVEMFTGNLRERRVPFDKAFSGATVQTTKNFSVGRRA